MEGAARLVLHGNDAWRQDYRVEADGYVGASWVRSYYAELRDSSAVDWHPYVYWRRRPYTAPTVFVLGGSTVWGTGSRDDETLPSRIARQLAASGRSARVVNYGESEYVLRQSVDTLIDRIQRGDVPRVAIFYGGVEDTFSAWQNSEPGIPQNEANRRRAGD